MARCPPADLQAKLEANEYASASRLYSHSSQRNLGAELVVSIAEVALILKTACDLGNMLETRDAIGLHIMSDSVRPPPVSMAYKTYKLPFW
jgi:hypothetical protein